MPRILALLPLLLAACGEQDVKIGDSADTAGLSWAMEVTADGQAATVDLGTLPTVDFEGNDVVKVTDVLDATGLAVTWSERTYDFVASDGYQPSTNDCPPVDYPTVQGGYFYRESGDLVWETALGLFGCYYVDGTVQIVVQDAR